MGDFHFVHLEDRLNDLFEHAADELIINEVKLLTDFNNELSLMDHTFQGESFVASDDCESSCGDGKCVFN